MRLYPPAWAMYRVSLQDEQVGGYRIPKGAVVLMSQWVIHRDSRYYQEPERFNPERWTDEFTKQLPKYAYFPFGGGKRLCIGKPFAMMQALLVLATLAQQFKFTEC